MINIATRAAPREWGRRDILADAAAVGSASETCEATLSFRRDRSVGRGRRTRQPLNQTGPDPNRIERPRYHLLTCAGVRWDGWVAVVCRARTSPSGRRPSWATWDWRLTPKPQKRKRRLDKRHRVTDGNEVHIWCVRVRPLGKKGTKVKRAQKASLMWHHRFGPPMPLLSGWSVLETQLNSPMTLAYYVYTTPHHTTLQLCRWMSMGRPFVRSSCTALSRMCGVSREKALQFGSRDTGTTDSSQSRRKPETVRAMYLKNAGKCPERLDGLSMKSPMGMSTRVARGEWIPKRNRRWLPPWDSGEHSTRKPRTWRKSQPPVRTFTECSTSGCIQGSCEELVFGNGGWGDWGWTHCESLGGTMGPWGDDSGGGVRAKLGKCWRGYIHPCCSHGVSYGVAVRASLSLSLQFPLFNLTPSGVHSLTHTHLAPLFSNSTPEHPWLMVLGMASAWSGSAAGIPTCRRWSIPSTTTTTTRTTTTTQPSMNASIDDGLA